MWLRFYIEDNIGETFIVGIPHYHTEYASKLFMFDMGQKPNNMATFLYRRQS